MNRTQTIDEWIQESEENRVLFNRDDFILDVTEQICGRMNEKGISRSDLAESLGKSKSFVSQVLNGHRNMTLGTLADIVHALKMKVKVRISSEIWDDAGLDESFARLLFDQPRRVSERFVKVEPVQAVNDQSYQYETGNVVRKMSNGQVAA